MRDFWSPRSYCDATGFELVRSGKMFAYFAKKSVIISVLRVCTVIFFLTKFCQALSNFKFLLGVSIIHILQPKESVFKCGHD